ncbi:MAG: hypothetical protein IJJ85_09465 [Clostridia bacterium]|nr:hypothetical protein [Clostridia bacterium]
MKQNSRRFLSVFLSALMIAALLLPGLTAFAACAQDDCPYIIVHGAGAPIVRRNADGTTTELFDDGEYISTLVSECLPDLAKGLLTGDWDSYTEKVLDIILPAYEGFAPATDGTLPENSYKAMDHSAVSANHSLNINSAFHFNPDVRVSPLDLADELNDYVEQVKAATGHDKVILISRCEGSATLLSYLYEYGRPSGYEGIQSVCLCDSTLCGMGYIEALFSGTVKVMGDAGLRYMSSLSMEDNTPQTAGVEQAFDAKLLAQLSELLKETYGVTLTAAMVNRMYGQLKDTLVAEILRAYYARVSGNWACVRERFDEAIDYVFPTEELKAEFAPIIANARTFHDDILEHSEEILSEVKAAGADVSLVVEYGYQQYPVSEDSEYVGDILASAARKSFGATTSKVEETLPAAYITRQTVTGFGRYISPDKQIDASTCLFPDSTWFIKNINHDAPDQTYKLVQTVTTTPGMTVATDEAYPQYLNYVADSPTLLPLEETNDNDVDWSWHGPSVIIELIKKVLNFFSTVFQTVSGWIDGIAGKATASPVV